ncbi:hypothetical protein NDU88_006496 [Pleurodeles waltl]|uniref:Uncharacterized protein n=1 Tax=Pleurodeles waltl TaxID=8319 RepID=A0AAV7TE55_PLEWA|nr:hypothetical protein NDU88_006496 [Pleurodeles waltl]
MSRRSQHLCSPRSPQAFCSAVAGSGGLYLSPSKPVLPLSVLPEGSQALLRPRRPRPCVSATAPLPAPHLCVPDSHGRTNKSCRSSPQWHRARSSVSTPQAAPPTQAAAPIKCERALGPSDALSGSLRRPDQPPSGRSEWPPVLLGAPPRLGGRLSQQDPGL